MAVDSMGRDLVSLEALDWTPVPGLGGTGTNLWPFAAARWGHAEPCAAGTARSCQAGTHFVCAVPPTRCQSSATKFILPSYSPWTLNFSPSSF